jgi:(E)-2-((N-methylformamido)methylene)succinate hydrolase
VHPARDFRLARPDGVEIAVRVEGQGPAVTLVHGVGADAASWDRIAERLVGRFTVVRADLRGHGRSSRMERCHVSDFVDDLLAALDSAGVASTDLVGFSLGGLIAQWFAIGHAQRVRRLVLLSTVAERTPAERARVLERADKVRDEGIASVVSAAEDRWFTPAFKAANPEKVALRLSQLKANDHRSYAAAYRVFAEADEGIDFAKIRCPTLVATGENDIGSNPRMARRMHEAIAGSRLVILPELRHSVLMEAPDRIADLILEFLVPSTSAA